MDLDGPVGNISSSQSADPTFWRKVVEFGKHKTEEKEEFPKQKKRKTNKADVEKPPAGKVKKIRLFPDTEQRKTLMKWFGTTRWTYNRCLSAVENDKVPLNKKSLRAKCLNSEIFRNENKWVLETPYDIRDEGMNDLLKAYESNFAAQKKNFKMKYRSKKAESESIVIHSKHWKSAGVFYPRAFGKMPIKAAEPLPAKLTYDCRLQKTRLGEYYLCIPMPLEVRGENQSPNWQRIEDGIISLDPGVRAFVTGMCFLVLLPEIYVNVIKVIRQVELP